MFASIAGVALALQLGVPAHPLSEAIPPAQEIRYRRQGRPPPCGHGYDLDERDGKCYPNGMAPPQFQSGRYYPLEYGGGRYHAATAQTSIFATGSATRRARCHGRIRTAARAITRDATATTKCDSAATPDIPLARWLISRGRRCGVGLPIVEMRSSGIQSVFYICIDTTAALDRDRATGRRVVETPAASGLIGEGP